LKLTKKVRSVAGIPIDHTNLLENYSMSFLI